MEKNIEQRMEIAKDIIFNSSMMLTATPIKHDTIKNKDIQGKCTGFQLEMDNLSYRGIWVSTIEEIKISLDGEAIPRGDMLLCLKGLKIPLHNLESHSEIFWAPEDTCTIMVNKVGGLPPGEHTMEFSLIKRPDFGHSYGEGHDGYEDAAEFLNPEHISDTITFTVPA